MAGTALTSPRNGLKGGRPKGSRLTSPEVLEQVRQIYREEAVPLAQIMLKIAYDEKMFAPTRIAAIDKIYDRAFGKVPQPVDGDGAGGVITIHVITGVPRRDRDG